MFDSASALGQLSWSRVAASGAAAHSSGPVAFGLGVALSGFFAVMQILNVFGKVDLDDWPFIYLDHKSGKIFGAVVYVVLWVFCLVGFVRTI